MADLFSSLPAELLDRIFSSLDHDRRTISHCRLVCSALKESSSPYLITRVVFARRLKALEKIDEVVAHPYFRKYITELFFDASWYDKVLAENWEKYVNACQTAPRMLDNGESAQLKEEDAKALRALQRNPKASEHGSEAIDNEPSSDVEGHDTAHEVESKGDHHSHVVLEWSLGRDMFHHWAAQSREEDVAGYDTAFDLGCYQSFHNYRRLYQAQEQIGLGGTGRVPNMVLEHVLTSLPRLRRVVVSDWRGLAQPRENYDACAHRLFGRTLAPNFMGAWHENRNYSLEGLLHVIRTVAGHKIESLAIGPQPFENEDVRQQYYVVGTGYASSDKNSPNDGLSAQYLPISAFRRKDLDKDLEGMTALRHLRLTIRFDSFRLADHREPKESNLPRFLSAAATLTHLTLCLKYDRVDGPWDRFWSDPEPVLPFQFCFQDVLLPCLRLLDLRGWIISRPDLQDLLSHHASTLRELRLLKCYIGGEPEILAAWAGEHLHLAAIGLDAGDGGPEYLPMPPKKKRMTSRQPRSSRQEKRQLLSAEDEELWLGGRENGMVREHRRKGLDDEGEEWYLKPVCW